MSYRHLMVIVACLMAGPALAAGPQIMNHQGALRNLAGDPVNGEFSLRFRMFKNQTHLLPLWQETHDQVSVTGGRYSLLLGAETPITPAVFANGDVWLEVTVDDEEPFDRGRLGSAGFAHQSLEADRAKDLECSGCVDAGELAPGAVTSASLANAAVTANKLASGAVGAAALSSSALDLMGQNVIPNGGFELGLMGWAPLGVGQPAPQLVEDAAFCRTGKRCIMWNVTGESVSVQSSAVIPVIAHAGTATVRAWIRGSGLSYQGAFKLQTGALSTVSDSTQGTFGWHVIEATQQVTSDGEIRLLFASSLSGITGELWLDDIEVVTQRADHATGAASLLQAVTPQTEADLKAIVPNLDVDASDDLRNDVPFSGGDIKGGGYALFLEDDAVKTHHLAPLSVDAAAMVLGAVGTTALADGAVTSAKVASKAIGAPQLADSSVTGVAIASKTITFNDIADATITPEKLAPVPLASLAEPVWAPSNDGPGSGLDADTLDGHHATHLTQQVPVHQGQSSWSATLDAGNGFIDSINSGAALAYGPDGVLNVVYIDAVFSKLYLNRCTSNQGCPAAGRVELTSGSNSTARPAAAFMADGKLWFVTRASGSQLQLNRCETPACTQIKTVVTVGGTDVTRHFSLARSQTGWPALTYQLASSNAIGTRVCSSGTCSSMALHNHGGVGAIHGLDAASPASGELVFAVVGTDGRLGTGYCADAQCDGQALVLTDTGADGAPSITVDGAGLPVMAYHHSSGWVRVARCFDAGCQGAIFYDVAKSTAAGRPSVSVGLSGLPSVAFPFSGPGAPNAVRLAHCTDPTCGDNIPLVNEILALAADTAGGLILVHDAQGLPVLGYNRDVGATGTAHLFGCGDAFCRGWFSRR